MNAKADRLKAALRENLKRRKTRARERNAPDGKAKPDKAEAEPSKEASREK